VVGSVLVLLALFFGATFYMGKGDSTWTEAAPEDDTAPESGNMLTENGEASPGQEEAGEGGEAGEENDGPQIGEDGYDPYNQESGRGRTTTNYAKFMKVFAKTN
jgi:hypothetical protein